MTNKTVLRLFALLIAFGAILFQLPAYGDTDDTASTSAQAASKQLAQVTGYPKVVVVSGTNYQMGYQYGQQAAELIYQNKLTARSKLEGIYGKTTVDDDIKVWTYYLEKYDRKYKEWLNGITAGCRSKRFNVTYADLVLIMVYPEELWARPTDPYPKETRVKPRNKNPKFYREKEKYCSAFAATYTATPDGKPFVSISAGMDSDVNAQVILIAFPTEGNSFVALPHAGRTAGNQGMSSKFAWVMPAAPTWHSIWGVSPEMYFHYLVQYAQSPAEAQDFIASTPRGGVTGNFFFADPAGPIQSFETNSLAYAQRNPGDVGETDFLIMVNHFVHPDMVQYNGYDGQAWDPVYSDNTYRYATLFEYLIDQSRIQGVSLDYVKTVWRGSDWYDPYASTWHYNDPLSYFVPANGGFEHFHIFYPADKTAYIQYGNARGPGAVAYGTGEYTKIQLVDSIPAVAEAAKNDAYGFCSTALEKYYKLDNDGKFSDLTFKGEMEETLNEGYLAMSDGTAVKSDASFTTNMTKRMSLYGSAMTYYSTAQLKCQMVSTKLNGL